MIQNEISTNLGLPERPLTQNPELALELRRVYNAINSLARNMDAYSGRFGEEASYYAQASSGRFFHGMNSKFYVESGETIEVGKFVGIKDDGKAYLAIWGESHEEIVRCLGFCTGVEGTTIELQYTGVYPTLPEDTLVPGALYKLSDTTAGNILPVVETDYATGIQVVGVALSDTTLFVNPQLVLPKYTAPEIGGGG